MSPRSPSIRLDPDDGRAVPLIERLVSLGVIVVSHVLQELKPGSATFRFTFARDRCAMEFGSPDRWSTGADPEDDLYTEADGHGYAVRRPAHRRLPFAEPYGRCGLFRPSLCAGIRSGEPLHLLCRRKTRAMTQAHRPAARSPSRDYRSSPCQSIDVPYRHRDPLRRSGYRDSRHGPDDPRGDRFQGSVGCGRAPLSARGRRGHGPALTGCASTRHGDGMDRQGTGPSSWKPAIRQRW